MRLNKRGVSFIEILMMLLVLAVCIIPMINMFTSAMGETSFVDDKLTAIDLAREEVEKVKNLGLSKDQIKKIGNVVSPPIFLNRKIWRTARVVNADNEPLEVYVYVFQGDDLEHSFVTLATMVNK